MRVGQTIHLSDTAGTSWRDAVNIDPGPSGYSALAAVNQSVVALAWESSGSIRFISELRLKMDDDDKAETGVIADGIAGNALPHVDSVEISNVMPQLDVDGKIVQAKDGNMVFRDGLWHQFGTSYGLCKEDPPPHSGCITMKVGSCGFHLVRCLATFLCFEPGAFVESDLSSAAHSVLLAQGSQHQPLHQHDPRIRLLETCSKEHPACGVTSCRYLCCAQCALE
eukprot:SAG31_NODE_1672_length_7564_cov_10.193704_6_plen_224_part_00